MATNSEIDASAPSKGKIKCSESEIVVEQTEGDGVGVEDETTAMMKRTSRGRRHLRQPTSASTSGTRSSKELTPQQMKLKLMAEFAAKLGPRPARSIDTKFGSWLLENAKLDDRGLFHFTPGRSVNSVVE